MRAVEESDDSGRYVNFVVTDPGSGRAIRAATTEEILSYIKTTSDLPFDAPVEVSPGVLVENR